MICILHVYVNKDCYVFVVCELESIVYSEQNKLFVRAVIFRNNLTL